jgi:hemolysin activation/secretion protein
MTVRNSARFLALGSRCFAIIAAGLLVVASAQAAPNIPGTAQPGAVERTLQQKLPVAHEDRIQLPAPEGFGTPQGAESFHFTLHQVVVDGANALPADAVAATYGPLLGHDVTLAQIYDVARHITGLYAKAGYALSFALVPAQDIDKSAGVVRIDVVEGYVGEVRYDGDTEGLARIVGEYGENITLSKPLKTATLERFLLLMNDLPGYKVSGVFDRIANAPKGDTRLIVKVEYRPVDASGEVDNRGSKAFGPWQAGVTASLNSLLGQGESVMIHALRALNANQLSAGVMRVSVPLSDNGLTFTLNTTYSDGHPGSAVLSALHFASNGWTASAQLNYPLLRSRGESVWLWGGVSGKWLKSQLLATPNTSDHLYELQAGAIWNERDPNGLTTATATLTQGLDVFDATTSASLLRSRLAGSGAFTMLSGTITRLEPLSQTSAGDLDLYAAAMGQLASRGLLSVEQCGYGGVPFGRGFDANEIVGDHCLLGTAELRLTPALGDAWAGGAVNGLQLFAVADVGQVWNTGHLGFGDKASESGASIGLGARFGLLEGVSGSLEYDQPLGHGVALEGNRAGRVFFQLGISN